MGRVFREYYIVIFVKGIGIEDEERRVFREIGNVIE